MDYSRPRGIFICHRYDDGKDTAGHEPANTTGAATIFSGVNTYAERSITRATRPGLAGNGTVSWPVRSIAGYRHRAGTIVHQDLSILEVVPSGVVNGMTPSRLKVLVKPNFPYM